MLLSSAIPVGKIGIWGLQLGSAVMKLVDYIHKNKAIGDWKKVS
jgi:hypothetical protein